MLSENPVLGFVDLGGESGRSTSVGMDLLHQTAVGLADFRVAVTQPVMPLRVSALIRLHGVVLWARGLPVVRRRRHVEQNGAR